MFAIVYKDKEGPLYYSVENGDFGARGDATEFRCVRDAKMVKLGIHENQALSLQKLEIVKC